MDDQIRKLTPLQKARIVGLFLSKFDREGIQFLGFRSRNELCNVVGLALGARSKSIQNYRDEFDPLFPNPRKGWNRPIRRCPGRFTKNTAILVWKTSPLW